MVSDTAGQARTFLAVPASRPGVTGLLGSAAAAAAGASGRDAPVATPAPPPSTASAAGLAALAAVAAASAASRFVGGPRRRLAGGSLRATRGLVARATAVAKAAPAPRVARQDGAGSRILAVVGADGAGKSKLCAALLEDAPSKAFADKMRLLEHESAEDRRNFSCYSHVYSQREGRGLSPRLHLIDTPGHPERLPLVEQALSVAHGAVLVCSAKDGAADAGCSHILEALRRSQTPFVVFLNGIDQADDTEQFEASLEALELNLGVKPVPLFAPMHVAGLPTGARLLDVIGGALCSPFECTVGGGRSGAVSGGRSSTDWATQLRDQAVEAIAGEDDELMEAYVELEGKVPTETVKAALRRTGSGGDGTRAVVPLVAGSAKTGLGIDALQEAGQTLVPPGDGDALMSRVGLRPSDHVTFDRNRSFIAWVFGERFRGSERLLEVRVLQGTLIKSQSIKVLTPGYGMTFEPEEILVHGLRGRIDTGVAAGPGDIALVVAPKDLPAEAVSIGCVLADKDVAFTSTEGTAPSSSAEEDDHCVLALRLNEIKDISDRERLISALRSLEKAEGIAGMRLEENAETREYLLHCFGLLHLELIRERLAQDFKVLRLPVGKPRVAYRATIKTACKGTGNHEAEGKTKMHKGIVRKQGVKLDAWARVEILPAPQGAGVAYELAAENGPRDKPCGDKVSREAAAALESGIRDALRCAGPGGVPVTDVQVRLLDAEAKEPEAAGAAAGSAVRKALEEVSVSLLEPIATVSVSALRAGLADKVVADLEAHRGAVMDIRAVEGDTQAVDAEVPLRELGDYAERLRALTEGGGVCSFHVEEYREVSPPILAQKIYRELEEIAA